MANDPNPIGEVYSNILVDYINEVIESWKKNNPIVKSWFGSIKTSWFKAVSYIITATDYFIRQVEQHISNGADKKATVLDALAKVYDKIVPELLPIYVKPFNARIKDFVINTVASIIIDFVVAKYNNGQWAAEPATFKG